MNRTIKFLAMAAILTALWPQSGNAASAAADYIAQQQAALGCGNQPGIFTQLWETDITGDGKKDLILDHANLKCANGESSSECGASGACQILVFVRKGSLLAQTPLPDNVISINKLTSISLSLVIGPGVSAKAKIVRWNGKKFK